MNFYKCILSTPENMMAGVIIMANSSREAIALVTYLHGHEDMWSATEVNIKQY